MKDLFDNILAETAIAPAAAVTNDTAFVSAIADRSKGEGLTFLGLHGQNDDGNTTYTVLVEDGDDPALADNAAVPDAYLLGVEAMGLDYSKDSKTFKIGYIGPKRYVRVTITPANNTGNAFICGAWIYSALRKAPKTTQIN